MSAAQLWAPEAEQAVIGALLIDNRVYAHVADNLRPEHFYDVRHGHVYAELAAQIKAGVVADVLTVSESGVADATTLNDLAQYVPGPSNIRRYADLVIERARSREMMRLVSELAFDSKTPIEHRLADARAKLSNLEDDIKRVRTLRLVEIATVLSNPSDPPTFAWDGYLPRGVVSLMGAHGGTGKSTIALMLCVATALGRPMFDAQTARGEALFVSLEDSDSVVRARLATICRAWSINPNELNGRLHLVDGTEHPELFDSDGRSGGATTRTYAELRELVKDMSLSLFVIDNASDAFGGDEINRRQVRAFIRSLGGIAKEKNCAALLLSHVDKATSRSQKSVGGEGYSGSTAWHNSVRSRLFMSRADDGRLTLEHQKSNFSKLREPIELVWPENGFPQLAAAGVGDDFSSRLQGRADDERAAALLRLIAEFEGRGQYCHTAQTSRMNPWAVFKSEPAFQKLKINSDATKRIVNQCQRAGWLEPLDYKTPDRKPHQRWTVTDEGQRFASLTAPTAPTAPTTEDGTQGAGGAPTAPTA